MWNLACLRTAAVTHVSQSCHDHYGPFVRDALQAVLLEAIEDAGFEGEALQEADSNTVTLLVEGMTCSSCSSAVENAVASQKGVVSAAVNLLAKRAEVGQPACASGSL